jgi:hypothetical protein
LGLVAFLLLLTVILSFSSVQTYVAKKATAYVNDTYGLNAELNSLRYIFPDEVQLGEVFIPTDEGDTLIYAKELGVKVGGYSQLTSTLGLREVRLDQAKFYLLIQRGDSVSSLSHFISKFSTGDTSASKPFNMAILDIELIDSRFWLEDMNCDSNCAGAFKFVDINGQLSGFDLAGSAFDLEVEELSTNDLYGLEVEELWGEFAYRDTSISLIDFHLKTARSDLNGDYSMHYASIADMSDYIHKVRMVADLEASTVSSKDVQHFAPSFPNFKTVEVAGKLNGPVEDMHFEDLRVGVGSQTVLEGDIVVKSPTSAESLFVDATRFSVQTITADAEYFYNLFVQDTLPEIVGNLGAVSYRGMYKGYLKDFTTQGSLVTDLGEVEVDLSFDDRDRKDIHYKGDIRTEGFDLGSLLGTTSVGSMAFNLSVDGEGFDPNYMNTLLKGNIEHFDALDYRYTRMKVNGKIADRKFKGAFSIDDPNLKFVFDGGATFQGDTSSYDFIARIEKADLVALNLVKEDSISRVSGELDIDLVAYNYEDWRGKLLLTEITHENEDNFYFFQDVVATSTKAEKGKQLSIQSNILDATVEGTFSYAGIFAAFKHEVSKYVMGGTPTQAPAGEEFTFDFNIKNTQLLTEIFVPKLSIEPNSRLYGSYADTTHNLSFALQSKGFTYDAYTLQDVDLNYKGATEKSELGFFIGAFKTGSGFEIDSIKLGNFYYHDTLFYTLSAVVRDSVDGKAALSGYALQEDTALFEFGVFESNFNVGYQDFVIQNGNKIFLDTSGVHIQNLQITNGERLLAINGNVSDNENEILRVSLQGFGMSLINYFVATPEARFKGKLYGDVILSQLLGAPRFAADLRIDSLKMNDTPLGDLSVTSDWSTKNDTISLAANMMLGELKTFEVKGYYQADSTGSIDFDVNFDRFRLAALNPFVSGIAENMRGFLEGDIKVSGPVAKPKIEGAVQLPKVAFTISFLQTDYNLEGTPTVEFKQDRIVFPDLKLRDSKYGTAGVLSGQVTHDQFTDFKLDLKIKANELLVLNTPPSTEDAYYGTAFATGDIRMKGAPSKLKVSANITTERKTSFNIPLGGSTTASQKGFITFVDRSKPDTTSQKVERLNLDKGISIDFDLNVNENAQVSIILDERTGNKLLATGNGNIRLNINPGGELELYGTYTIKEGKYNFNLQNFFNKEFVVQQGSSVTFNGSPFDAIVDITAVYTTRADPTPVVPGYTGGRTLTEVYLNIDGNLTSPDITFDIKTPRAGPLVQAVVGNIGSTDQKTEQVFSLLATNSFMPESGVSNNSLGNVVNAWDMLANQAASWFNVFSDRYDLSLNYQSDPSTQVAQGDGTYTSQEELEVGLSTTFFDDRVTVNGSVGVPVGQNRNSLAGEAEIEYNISKDGRFRVKVFNRQLDNPLVLNNAYQQGVGLYYRIDFDNGRDFWNKLLGRQPKETGVEEEEEQGTDGAEPSENAATSPASK